MPDKRGVNVRTTYHTMCEALQGSCFYLKNDDAVNKRFTNRVTRSVLEIRSLHFYARPSQARAVRKRSWYEPSNPVSKSLVQHEHPVSKQFII